MKKLGSFFLILLFPLSVFAFKVGDTVSVEYFGACYPATVIGENNYMGIETVQGRYIQSGLVESFAKNRVVKSGRKCPQIGAFPYSGKYFQGKKVLLEFNGGWYPGTLLKKKKSYGVDTYEARFDQSGLKAWFAPNRVK